MSETSSGFSHHSACASCGSSDGNAVYNDGSTHCFVCKATTQSGEKPQQQRRPKSTNMIPLNEIDHSPLTGRKLNADTLQKWGYGRAKYKGETVHVATYRDSSGTPVAQKVRFADKRFLILGDASRMGLYGEHLWRDGGKRVVVTEGELDALSVSQMQNNRWPVVSVPNGSAAAKKAVAASLEWLEKFEEVVLLFDGDEPGQKAIAECIELFTPGKVKVAKLALKDASDMLQAGRGSEIIDAIWGAKTLRPDGVIAGTDLYERWENRPKVPSLPFIHTGLNRKTEGCREGEVVLFTSGSGMGKTEVVGQIEYDWCMNHNESVGVIHLEEPILRSADRFVGLHMKKRIHLDHVRTATTKEERKLAFQATVGNGKLFFYDHFGSAASETLFSKIRYYVRGCGCKTIVLDHISIVVSGIVDGDERRIIDNLMTKLASIAQELSCRMILVCHLKRKEGKPYNEGGEISLSDLRGSGSLEQLSHTVIALERNQQDEEKKHWTKVRVLKCRHTGDTGVAGWLRYDVETGWLHEDVPMFDEDSPANVFKDETRTLNKDFA